MRVLFLLTLPSLSFAWSYSRCPLDCVCESRPAHELDPSAELRTVDCAGKGLRHFPAPEHLPSDAQVIRLAGNRIRRLRPGLRLWLPDLMLLDLSDNRLAGLPATLPLGAFEGLASLRQLSLARNSLRRVGDGAFAGLLELTHLDLSDNRLDGVSDDAFQGLNKLETLNLSGNKLSFVLKAWWSGLPGLLNLDMSRNSLSLVQADAFTGLRHLRQLDLSGNRLFRLNEHSFYGLRRLSSLSLAANSLTALPAAALKDLRPSLKSLDASRNPLYRLSTDDLANFVQLSEIKLASLPRLRLVERGAFKNLPGLIVLELRDCPYLAYLDPTAFVNTHALSRLLLQNNALSVLEAATLDALPGLAELSFYGNPLVCDCNARWLAARLANAEGRLTFREADRIICAAPSEHQLKRLAKISPDDLPRHCKPRLISLFDRDLERKLGEDIALDCRAVGLPKPSLTWVDPVGDVVRPEEYHARRVLRHGATLILRHLQFQDAGGYTCLAESERGEALAVARLNVSSIQVEIVPLETGARTATVAWRGLDRSANVFQIMYRKTAGGQTRHRYGGSVSPALRSYTLRGLEPASEYEICLAFEDGQGILTHISCAFMTTQPLAGLEALSSRLASRPPVILAAITAIIILGLLLCLAMAVAARRRRRPSFAYDNLLAVGELGSPELKPRRSLPHLEGQSSRQAAENVYSPLVPGQFV